MLNTGIQLCLTPTINGKQFSKDTQAPYSACSTHCIGYNHCESPAIAGATPSGKSQLNAADRRGVYEFFAKSESRRVVPDRVPVESRCGAVV